MWYDMEVGITPTTHHFSEFYLMTTFTFTRLTAKQQLEQIIQIDEKTGIYEEDAQDFIEDNGLKLCSHSRRSILTTAFFCGWRPAGFDQSLHVSA